VEDFVDTPAAKRLPRHTQFALAGTVLALADAGLTGEAVQKLIPVIVTGASLMDSEVVNKTIENVARRGPRFGLTRVVFHGPIASIGSAIAEIIGGGRSLSLQSACCSGSDAIGHAAAMVANGESDLAICGGTEAPIFYHPMLELKMAGLSPDTADRPTQLSRPFDMWRTTGVIGEGAGIMILEPESSPRPGYAFISGYSFATDPIAEPGLGQLEAIRLCLANAGMRPPDIDVISAWGPGHKAIDAVEARVLRQFFGAEIDRILAVSIKGAIGNPFAAAGAIQAGCVALGMRDGFIPPTVNWLHPDPACRLNLSAQPRILPFNTALVNSHGLSGTNSCLLLERCK
jgi:3-oxoacyl-(acyl-carrier-protein) synthase